MNDANYSVDAPKNAFTLLTNVKKPDAIPAQYLELFKHEYADGDSSYLDILNKVEFGEEKPDEELYKEVITKLAKVKPGNLPPKEDIESIPAEALVDHKKSTEFEDFEDFSEEEDFAMEVERFLKLVIASVYRPGVTRLEPTPSADNNYLFDDDKDEFTGSFYDDDLHFYFSIFDRDGTWSISYKPDKATQDKLM